MATARNRTKLRKAGPLDAWSTKERLCLASSVLRNGDKNWPVVSHSLKAFLESDRPPNWFSPDKCELQYIALLEGFQIPKRKKRGVKKEDHLRTIRESIVRKLTEDRVEELQNLMHEEQQAYLKMKDEVESLKEDEDMEKQGTVAKNETLKVVPGLQEKKDKHIFKVPAMVTKHRQTMRGTSLLNPYTSTASSAAGSPDHLIKPRPSDDHAYAEQRTTTNIRTPAASFKIPPSSLSSTSRVFRATKSPLLTRLLQTTQAPLPQPSKPLNIITQVPAARSQNILCVLNGVPTLITGPKSNIPQNQQQQHQQQHQQQQQQQLLFGTIGTRAENRPKIQSSMLAAGSPALSRMLHVPPAGPLQTASFSSRPPQLLYIPLAHSVANIVTPKLSAGTLHGQHIVTGIQSLPKNEKLIGLMPVQHPDGRGNFKQVLCPVEFVLGHKNISPSPTPQVIPSTCSPFPSTSRFLVHTEPETNLPDESPVPLHLPDDTEISEPFLNLSEELDILQETSQYF